MPPLIFAEEARSLQSHLGQVAAGNAFLLQAGDCAESFEEFSADNIREKLRVILQMAIILTYSVGVPTVKVGRMAGQFAKPRSSDFETVGDARDPVVPRAHRQRPDVDRSRPDAEPRAPGPGLQPVGVHAQPACARSPRAASPTSSRVHAWTQEFVAASPAGQRYEQLASEIDRALSFMRACGIETEQNASLSEVDVYTSHEALILGYEEALTRKDSITDSWYDCSAHMLWIGERTRDLDGAHVEFLRGVGNPIGCKVGPTTTADYLIELCEVLNPSRIPGRSHVDHADGRRQDRGRPAAPPARRHRCRPPGGVGVRPDARQHVHLRERPQDPRLRRHRRRDRRVRPSASRRGHLARRHPRRADRRRRDRVPRRRRGVAATANSTIATRRCATRD